MKKSNKDETVKLSIALPDDTQLDTPLAAYVFDGRGNFVERVAIKKDVLYLNGSVNKIQQQRVLIGPAVENEKVAQSMNSLRRLGAYEPLLGHHGDLVEVVRIPQDIVRLWLLCFCRIRGRVLHASSDQPICNARVHICEVDRIIWWLERLPELDIFRLRDELLEAIQKEPRIPIPQPDPPPFEHFSTLQGSVEGPETRMAAPLTAQAANAPANVAVSAAVSAGLQAHSSLLVRQTLIANVDLLRPYLCLWPNFWRYRCDEIAVVETDAFGRFETWITYPCNGDKPDLYFWVEFEIDGVWETVYRPTMACNTYWNYACGSEITLRIADPRVPVCGNVPDLPGCQVEVVSIGRTVSISEIQDNGGGSSEGLTTSGQPFGGKLEPRVWFSQTCLIEDKGIAYYRWSYRRKTLANGNAISYPDDETGWTALSRSVIRHYQLPPTPTDGTTHGVEPMGPFTVNGVANLFKIQPPTPPAGALQWSYVDEREDLASAHFMSHILGSGDNDAAKALDAAGQYELKLELFKDTGATIQRVNWDAEGITLKVATSEAPFGDQPVEADVADEYHRIRDGGQTVAFRMVLRVDNNACTAEIIPTSVNGISDSACGFIEYNPGDQARLGFVASHPFNFATFSFNVRRGTSGYLPETSASGQVGSTPISTGAGGYAFNLVAGNYRDDFNCADLLGACPQAAFSESVDVDAMATNGYGRLSGLDASSHAAFALAQPCPECECDDDPQ